MQALSRHHLPSSHQALNCRQQRPARMCNLAPRANLRDDIAMRIATAWHRRTPEKAQEREEELPTPSTSSFLLRRARVLKSPHIAIPADGVQHLFPGRDSSDTLQCVLALECDGVLLGENNSGLPALVELRSFKSRNSAWRVKGIKSFDAMHGMQLEGWRRDAHGRLVAVLRSTTQASSQNTCQQAAQQMLQTAQHHLQAAGAAVYNAAAHALERKRTYVPAKVRPISNEVFVPYGLWKSVINDGTGRPFPESGVPLRVTITGAVQMSEQPALLVRRISPYGYYVLRGIKGLSRLKGKLLVRWSLLVSGVIEMEVVERPAAEPAPGAITAAALAERRQQAAATMAQE